MSEPSTTITIRRAETIADYLACQVAQRQAWGLTDESYLVPIATMIGAQLHGGLVLGAFRESGEALGLSFAFLGKIHGRSCLYSQLTGVVPGQQGQGLGGRLKFAQREFARSEGLACLAWAFDPLQSGNARFNLDKLGATASTFINDMYGQRTDTLNAGASTDRLIVEWSTEDDRPESDQLDLDRLPRLIDTQKMPYALPEIDPDEPIMLLEIPEDIGAIRRANPELATAWSLAVRTAFQTAFGAGFRAESFVQVGSGQNYLIKKT